MEKEKILRKIVVLELSALAVLFGILFGNETQVMSPATAETADQKEAQDYIKWVDFQVTCEALEKAYTYDKETYGQPIHLNWIELLAYTAARTGGDFSSEKQVDSYMDEAAERLLEGEAIDTLAEGLQYYDYFLEAYTAVLGGMVGSYEIQVPAENEATEEAEDTAEEAGEEVVWESRYGLKAFHPIAKNFPYSDYDDFGVARSYGYKRQHLGHDFMGQTGTPI